MAKHDGRRNASARLAVSSAASPTRAALATLPRGSIRPPSPGRRLRPVGARLAGRHFRVAGLQTTWLWAELILIIRRSCGGPALVALPLLRRPFHRTPILAALGLRRFGQ